MGERGVEDIPRRPRCLVYRKVCYVSLLFVVALPDSPTILLLFTPWQLRLGFASQIRFHLRLEFFEAVCYANPVSY